jgi:hypothetical protein
VPPTKFSEIRGATASDHEHTQNIPVHLTPNHVRTARAERFAVNELVLFNDGLGQLASKKSKSKRRRKLQKELRRAASVRLTVNLNQPKRSNAFVRLLSRCFGLAASVVGIFYVKT